MKCNVRQAWENACERLTIGFRLDSRWLIKWHEFFQPITERSKVKPKQIIIIKIITIIFNEGVQLAKAVFSGALLTYLTKYKINKSKYVSNSEKVKLSSKK